MKLCLLGTTGYHPSDQRQTACFMIPEMGIILDAGTALYRARKYLATSELDIFLTHTHLDHVIGITYLFDVLRDRDVKRVTVHAVPEKLASIRDHLLAKDLFPVAPPCDFRPLSGPVTLPHGGTLTHFPLQHPGGAVGFRLDWAEHSLAYVTDTTATDDAPYAAAIAGVNLLIHECYFPDAAAEMARLTGHSVTSAVANLARASAVKRLVLVHVDPLAEGADPLRLDTARAIFPATTLGEDYMELEF